MTALQEFMAEVHAKPVEEREEWLLDVHDLVWWAETAPYKVLDKATRQMVPLKFRWGQQYVWRRAWQMAATDRPVRLVILKARQLGVTTLWLAHKIHVCTTQENRECYMLLHDLKPAQGKFRAAEQMLKRSAHLPAPLVTSVETGRRMTFETDSTLLIESVRKQGIGRAETLDHVHTTEEPSWDNPEEVLEGIEESVPQLPGFASSIIRESTAKGVGDPWYWSVKSAERGQGDYELVFIPWWLEPEYAGVRTAEAKRKPRRGESLNDVLIEPLTPAEEELGKRIIAEAPSYGMPAPSPDAIVAKMMWRRRKIANKERQKSIADPLGAFQQEYPATVDEAFMGSGSPRFRVSFTRQHRERTDKNGLVVLTDDGSRRYQVVRDDDEIVDGRARQVWRLDPKRGGDLQVWELPHESAAYVGGGDAASGEASDFSALQVLRRGRKHLEQVAVWHGHALVEDFAHITLAVMAKYGGLLVPETTGIGASYRDTLVKHRPRGRRVRLFRREVMDGTGKRRAEKYGFDTNEQSREQLIEHAATLIGSMEPVFRHEATMAQIEQFQLVRKRTQSGRTKERADAPSGAHDDLLFAWMLAAWGARQVRAGTGRRPVVARSMDAVEREAVAAGLRLSELEDPAPQQGIRGRRGRRRGRAAR